MKTNDFPDFKDISSRKIAYAASLIVIAFIAFAFLREIELKKDVPAIVVSEGEVKIRGVSGLVTEVHARPDMQVHAGQHLFQLRRDISLADNGMTRDRFAENHKDDQVRMIGQQASLKERELRARIDALLANQKNRRHELQLLDHEMEEMRRHIDEGQKALKRLQALSEYVIAERIEQARSDVAQRKIALSQRQARQRELLSDLNLMRSSQKEAQASLDSLGIQAQRDVQNVQMNYEQSRSTVTISAPVAGVVSFSRITAGNTLREEDVAMVITTGVEHELQVALRIASRQRGFIKEGQRIRLKFDAFPYSRFGTLEARIDTISRDTIVPAQGASVSASSIGDESDYVAYARLVKPEFSARGEHHRLLPGMRATASVVVEQRTIAEWVLAPVFEAIRG
jgi:membrane fusion protein